MAHFNGNAYDNFAFDPGSVGSDWQSGTQPAMRPIASRVSRLGIDSMGPRDSNDYTRTSLGFKSKGELENPKNQVGIGFGTDMSVYNYNPFVWGYAVAHRKMLGDNMFMMGMSSIDVTKGDISDRNYPNEGWSSFGKKGDGSRVWAGNTWVNGIA